MRENISPQKIGNSFFVFFLLYILTIIGTEWINFILYFCGVEINVGIAEGISLIICLVVFWMNRKKVEISPVTLDYQKLIGIFIIAVLDSSWQYIRISLLIPLIIILLRKIPISKIILLMIMDMEIFKYGDLDYRIVYFIILDGCWVID